MPSAGGGNRPATSAAALERACVRLVCVSVCVCCLHVCARGCRLTWSRQRSPPSPAQEAEAERLSTRALSWAHAQSGMAHAAIDRAQVVHVVSSALSVPLGLDPLRARFVLDIQHSALGCLGAPFVVHCLLVGHLFVVRHLACDTRAQDQNEAKREAWSHRREKAACRACTGSTRRRVRGGEASGGRRLPSSGVGGARRGAASGNHLPPQQGTELSGQVPQRTNGYAGTKRVRVRVPKQTGGRGCVRRRELAPVRGSSPQAAQRAAARLQAGYRMPMGVFTSGGYAHDAVRACRRRRRGRALLGRCRAWLGVGAGLGVGLGFVRRRSRAMG